MIPLNCMYTQVFVVDLTENERQPRNKVRICELDAKQLKLTFRWLHEFEILERETLTTERYQIDDVHEVMCDLDSHEEEDDLNLNQRNRTAQLFGLRGFGRCFAHGIYGEPCDMQFPDALRRWYYCMMVGVRVEDMEEKDMTMEQWTEYRRLHPTENSFHQNLSFQGPDGIQFIYQTIGFTSMSLMNNLDVTTRLPLSLENRYRTTSNRLVILDNAFSDHLEARRHGEDEEDFSRQVDSPNLISEAGDREENDEAEQDQADSVARPSMHYAMIRIDENSSGNSGGEEEAPATSTSSSRLNLLQAIMSALSPDSANIIFGEGDFLDGLMNDDSSPPPPPAAPSPPNPESGTEEDQSSYLSRLIDLPRVNLFPTPPFESRQEQRRREQRRERSNAPPPAPSSSS